MNEFESQKIIIDKMTVNFSGLCYIEVILYLCLHWQINFYYIFRWIHFILYFQITGTLEICMKKFDAEKIFFYKMAAL